MKNKKLNSSIISWCDGMLKIENNSDLIMEIHIKPIYPKRKLKMVGYVRSKEFVLYDEEIDIKTLSFSYGI